jgi:hypothetical protein
MKQSIDTVGIERWVDEHSPDGLSYTTFRRMRAQGASITSMAKTWGVTFNIMQKWITKDDLQNGEPTN